MAQELKNEENETAQQFQAAAVVIASASPPVAPDVHARIRTDRNRRGSVAPAERDVETVVNRLNETQSILVKQQFPDLSEKDPIPTTKQNVLQSIQDLFGELRHVYIIYYSGCGQFKTGNWCFDDEVLDLREIIGLWKNRHATEFDQTLLIIADSPFSGKWVQALNRHRGNIWMQASCGPDEICTESRLGGFFTNAWMPTCLKYSVQKDGWEILPDALGGVVGTLGGALVGLVGSVGSLVTRSFDFRPVYYMPFHGGAHGQYFLSLDGEHRYWFNLMGSFHSMPVRDCVMAGSQILSNGKFT